MSGIVLRNLNRRYVAAAQAPAAVEDVSFEVARGTLTTLLGPSGCGKSTVLRLIAGLESMDGGGEVWIGGRDVTAMAPEQRGVGLVFQNYALFPHLDVLDNVCFGMRALRLPVEQRQALGLKALHAAGLQGLEKRRPAQLSGGQQQRVALARALVLEPSVLLLDEPLSNLDARLRRSMRQEIRDLQRRLDLTVVYVTHDHHEALAVSDQIVVMNAGRVAQAGTPHALYESPSGEFVAAFMGDASLFNAHCDGAVMALGPLRIAAPEGAPAGTLRVAIRPEAWRIGPANGSGLPASVQKCTYQGHAIEYVFATPVGRVLAVSREVRYPLEPGAPASLHLAGHGICVLEPGAEG